MSTVSVENGVVIGQDQLVLTEVGSGFVGTIGNDDRGDWVKRIVEATFNGHGGQFNVLMVNTNKSFKNALRGYQPGTGQVVYQPDGTIF